jgi:hypothetical protein
MGYAILIATAVFLTIQAEIWRRKAEKMWAYWENERQWWCGGCGYHNWAIDDRIKCAHCARQRVNGFGEVAGG